MEIRICRKWMFLTFFLTITAAFEVSVVPTAGRLKEWKAGESLLMSCTVTDTDESEVSIEWLKDGKPVGAQNNRISTIPKSDHSMGMMIMRPVAEDAGTYVCKVTIGDESKEAPAEVTIIMAPTFVDAPTEQHPQENTEAKIVCRVEATPPATLVWRRNGVTLRTDHPREYKFEDDNQVLIIPDFHSEEDDGTYLCMAIQEPNIDSREINVTGYSPPKITLFSKPTEHGFEGQPLTLTCQGIGKPAPDYKWYKGTPEDENSGTVLEATDKYEFPEPGSLVIQALIEDDAGPYTCVASNDVAEARNGTTVTVFRKPKIAPIENVTATQGMKVELKCAYDGDGEITAKWIFKGETLEMPSSSETVSQHVDGKDKDEEAEDTYDEQYHATSNGMDEDSNNVVKKRRAPTRANRQADEEDEEEDAEKTKHMFVTAGDKSLTLTLEDVRLDDAAEYQCEATNEAGTDNRRVFLAITHAPSLVRKTDEMVRSYGGQTVSFFCEVSAVPTPTWVWTSPDGTAIVADADRYFIETSENGLKSSLKLKTTIPGDYGQYKCKASNGVGAPVEAEVGVLEVVRPPVPSQLTFDGEHPNFALITVESFDALSEAEKPTDIVFFYATAAQADEPDFDWDSCLTAVLDYAEQFELSKLTPSTEYKIRAQSKNEAGESALSEVFTYETSAPIAPAKPEFTRESDDVTAECDAVCEIKWSEPNNHGADISHYELKTTPVEVREDGTFTEIGEEVSREVAEGKLEAELSDLQPNTYYNVRLVAVNDVGASEPAEMIIKTSDQVQVASGLSVGAIVGIVAAVLFILLVIIDIACYLLNSCGVLACICVNCLGRTPPERKSKEMTMEEGAKPESAQLLTNKSAGDASVSVETNGNGNTNGHHLPKSHKATTV